MKKNYLYNLLLTVFNLLVPVISFPYVARVLGPVGVGKVQFILTLGQYVALIAALGIPIYGVREIAKAKHEPVLLSKTFSELVLINFITSLLYFIAYLAIITWVPFFQKDHRLFTYSSVLIILSFTSIDWFYAGLEAFKMIALRSIIVKIVSLGLIILFVRQQGDTMPYLVISMFSVLVNNLINLWIARKTVNLHLRQISLKKHMLPLVFIFGTTIASTLYTTFDSIILGFLAGDVPVGLYAAATKVCKISLPVIMAYGAVLIPGITKSHRDSSLAELQDTLNRSYAYIVMLSLPVCIGLFVFAPALIFLFSGSAFAPAIVTMRILSFLPFFIGLGYFWGYQVTLPFGKDKFLMFSAIAGMVTSVTLNFLLVPHMHENGAAIANVVSEVIVTACYFLLIRQFVMVRLRHAYIPEAFVSAAPFFLFLFVSNKYLLHSELLTLAANVIICAAIYVVMQLFVFKNHVVTAIIDNYKNKLSLK